MFQPHVNQIQMEHVGQHVEQRASNLGRFAANPSRRESENADQIINASAKALVLFGGRFEFPTHVSSSSGMMWPARIAFPEAHAETRPAVQRTDSAGGRRQ